MSTTENDLRKSVHRHASLKLTTEERFWCKVAKSDGCWEWLAQISNGYGIFDMPGGKGMAAHRASYQFCIGPIPEGHEIHHVCENRRCVNPAHLLAVTRKDHILKYTPQNFISQYARRTHCNHGHEWTPENTKIRQGARRCATCEKIQGRKDYEKRRNSWLGGGK